MLEQTKLAHKQLLAAGALLQFGGLFVTFSRTPLLAFVLGMFMLQFFYPSLRKLLFIMLILLGVGLLVNWERFQQTDIAQDRVTMGSRDFDDRFTRWQVGWQMWREKPVQGWGQGRFEERSGQYRTDGYSRNINAVENDYLYILLSAGLIGFVPYALFLLVLLGTSVSLYFRKRSGQIRGFIRTPTIALFWAVMASFLITSFTAMNALTIAKLLPFAIAGAIIGSQEHLLKLRRTPVYGQKLLPLSDMAGSPP
jgi:O-antigen ligase